MTKPAAIGVIFSIDKTRVLLIKRSDVPVWVLPGGGIEKGETPEEAVCREVWEETGLRVRIVRKIAYYTPLNHLAKPTHVFECQPMDGLLRTGCETQAIAYHELGKLPESFFIVHQDWLQDVLLNKLEVIHKPIWRVTYWEVFKYFCRRPLQVIKFILSRH
jgi:8-oxo-dGTP diphosphatase